MWPSDHTWLVNNVFIIFYLCLYFLNNWMSSRTFLLTNGFIIVVNSLFVLIKWISFMFTCLLLFYFKHLYSIYYCFFQGFTKLILSFKMKDFLLYPLFWVKNCNDIIFFMKMSIYINVWFFILTLLSKCVIILFLLTNVF
jgi:hypothetical protein